MKRTLEHCSLIKKFGKPTQYNGKCKGFQKNPSDDKPCKQCLECELNTTYDKNNEIKLLIEKNKFKTPTEIAEPYLNHYQNTSCCGCVFGSTENKIILQCKDCGNNTNFVKIGYMNTSDSFLVCQKCGGKDVVSYPNKAYKKSRLN